MDGRSRLYSKTVRSIESDNGNYYLKFQYGGLYHSSDGVGDGLINILFIVDALYDSKVKGEIIVIDEPDLSLHPSLQKKLFSLLADYAKDRQIIYATHSPYFIDWEAVLNGAKIVRVHKKDNQSVLSPLKQETVNNLKGLVNNDNNPHILGLDAREIFFLDDDIILVEGQEDVVFYKKYIAREFEIPGNFFGWGVGGAGNMYTIAQILSDFGFLKVVGILDKNKADEEIKLTKKFPEYKFFVIPADDIRSKREVKEKQAITGLLDEKHNLREEYREETQEIFQGIKKYFQVK